MDQRGSKSACSDTKMIDFSRKTRVFKEQLESLERERERDLERRR